MIHVYIFFIDELDSFGTPVDLELQETRICICLSMIAYFGVLFYFFYYYFFVTKYSYKISVPFL